MIPFSTPVLFIVFNRLDTVRTVFDEILKKQPKYLYIAADGPRPNKVDEKEKCEAVRSYLLSKINWDCELKTLFRETNLGCGKAVSSAITWFFDNVEEGIILEDDCLPDPSFFEFCSIMLERYRDTENILSISGDNFQNGIKRGDGSYYFSNYADIWGWASWRRAWEKYDFSMKDWPVYRDTKLKSLLHGDKKQINFWTNTLNSVYEGKIDTWDYQLMFSHWNSNGLAVHPNTNLISNIGFNSEGTHTTNPADRLSNRPRYTYTQDIIPSKIIVSTKADDYNFYKTHLIENSSENQFNYLTKKRLKLFVPSALISFYRRFK